MVSPFLRFENGKISLNNKDLMVSSANLSISPNMQTERVYGDYLEGVSGSRVDFVNFAPTNNLQGQLNITFYISADTLYSNKQTNTIDRLFEIKEGMSELPINTNRVGRYFFDNMYLKSFGFSFTPYQLIRAQASYDIYGSIQKEGGAFLPKTEANFAHGLKSFGEMKATGLIADQAIDGQFEITSLKYNILVERKPSNSIRASENTRINTQSSGVRPTRVNVGTIESEMNIECNDMIPYLNSYGDQQLGSSPQTLQQSEVSAHLYSMQQEKIATFSTRGKIQTQSTSISEGDYAKSNITIKQIIK